MQSIREIISAYCSEVANGNVLPDRAATILIEIAAVLGNINEEILNREMAYNKIYDNLLDENKKANRAKIRVQTSDEYRAMREAKNTFDEAEQLMQALKYYLKVKESEWRAANHQ